MVMAALVGGAAPAVADAALPSQAAWGAIQLLLLCAAGAPGERSPSPPCRIAASPPPMCVYGTLGDQRAASGGLLPPPGEVGRGREALRLRGAGAGDVGAGSGMPVTAAAAASSVPDGHSAAFLADAKRRKSRQSQTGERAAVPDPALPGRSPQDILAGAMRRESTALHNIPEPGSWSVAELREKLRALGASEADIRSCTEKRDLVDLLMRYKEDVEVVDWREDAAHDDDGGFQVA